MNLTSNVLDTALGIWCEEGLVLNLKNTQFSGGGQDANKVILCLLIQLIFFLQVSSMLGTCSMNGTVVDAKNYTGKGRLIHFFLPFSCTQETLPIPRSKLGY